MDNERFKKQKNTADYNVPGENVKNSKKFKSVQKLKIELSLNLLKEISNKKIYKEVLDMFRMGRKFDRTRANFN